MQIAYIKYNTCLKYCITFPAMGQTSRHALLPLCRFGVEQRARLAAKATPSPHVMYMTATPIPRTLALCEHGDLALYTIDELPPGRQPVTTRVIKDSAKGRAQVSCQLLLRDW